MRPIKIIILLIIQTAAITIATAQSHISDTLHVYFRVGKTAVDTSYMGNGTTLKTFEKFFINNNSPLFNYSLQKITLQGSASPEGKQHWNTILANRRAEAVNKIAKKLYPEYQQLVQKDNVTLNFGAHYSTWKALRSTRIVIDYLRYSKMPVLPPVQQRKMPSFESEFAKTPISFTAKEDKAYDTLPSKNESKGLRFALKTNALYDLLLTPNIGIEVPVLNNWSVAANWMYAWWKSDANNWYHRIYGGDIEVRRWFGTQTDLTGWHIGAYAQMLTYDFEFGGNGELADRWTYGAGMTMGWSKNIAPKLNLDFTLGIGYLTGEYKEYKPQDDCYVWQSTKNRKWIGPTKAEVSLVWLLGRW